ncbi:hypothetical protein AADR41_22100 [Streptomyces sp. CLV115]|uniref:hypothetical protein n=1 Tax=Streptomyces sp. CLV115 TaxID=3138502 RepID=UPI00313B0ABD
MRTRFWLTSVALGAALVTGGTVATAQAASASSDASTAAYGPVVPFAYTDVGTYSTEAACLADGESSIYSDWFCRQSTTTSNWHLWVNLNS